MTSDDSSQDVDTGRESLLSLGARAGGIVLGFVTLAIIARHLGPSGLGRYAFLFAIGLIASVLSTGVGDAVKKRISETDSEPDQLLGFGLLLHIASVALVLTSTLAASVLLTQLSTTGALAISAIAFGRGLLEAAMAVKSGLGSPGASYWYDTGQTFLTGLVQIPIAILGGSATMLLGGYAFASVAVALAMLVRLPVSVAFPTHEIRQSVAEFARWSVPNRVITALYNRCEEAWFGILGGATVVGYLDAATRVATPGTIVPWSLSNALVVRISQLHSRGESVLSEMETGMRYAGLASIPLFFGALSLSKKVIITVFGSAFSDAAVFLVVIAFVYVIRSYTIQLSAYLNALNAPNLRFRGQIIAVVIKVTLIPLLLVTYSTEVALLTLALSELTLVMVYGYHIRELVGEVPLPREILLQVACGLVMFVSIETTPQVFSGVLHVVTHVGFGGLLYVVLLLAVSPPLRNRVQELVARYGPVAH